MRELSLHILDIIQNSIAAQADIIKLIITENRIADQLVIKIIDNGCGIDPKLQEEVTDPFITSRTTRQVGLGLPLFRAAAEECGGGLEINSSLEEGTEVIANFRYSHWDRAPLGDIVGTLLSIIAVNSEVRLVYQHEIDGVEFSFDTAEVKEKLEEMSINHPQVISWLDDYLTERLEELRGGD